MAGLLRFVWPVSYTHLDVYKRQAQHRLEIIFCFQEERDALEAAYHELEGGEAR